MIPYIEKPKDSSKKLLELISKFDKAVGFKINIQKLVAFLYTNNELSEKEIKKTIPFATATATKNKVPKNKFNQGGKTYKIIGY